MRNQKKVLKSNYALTFTNQNPRECGFKGSPVQLAEMTVPCGVAEAA